MDTIYLICAALGGTLLVCQFLMSVLGFGDHHDVDGHDVGVDHADHGDHGADHDQGHSWFVGVLTFRTVVAALTFFGLAGLAGSASGEVSQPVSLLIALAAGLAALFLVASLMKGLHKLRAEGTVRIDRAVGKNGTVYLRVPGNRTGTGKVQLNLQNRTVEYQAVTSKEQELPTGAKIVVVGVISGDTVEVALAE